MSINSKQQFVLEHFCGCGVHFNRLVDLLYSNVYELQSLDSPLKPKEYERFIETLSYYEITVGGQKVRLTERQAKEYIADPQNKLRDMKAKIEFAMAHGPITHNIGNWQPVSSWLAAKLREKGEPVLMLEATGCFWPRSSHEQNLYDTPVINEIIEENLQ